MEAPHVLGVDGCRAGWVGIVLAPDDVVIGVFGRTIGALVDAACAAGPPAVIGIDMPLYPPDVPPRAADLAARAHLGRKASSIFPTLPRAVLDAASYADACAAARRMNGSAISRQAWALRAKTLEVGAWQASAPCPLYEVHPEVSFSLLAGAPIMARKTSWAGLAVRRAALESVGITVPDDIGPAGAVAGADDVLDAVVVAWSARRIATGTARSFPEVPALTPEGRADAIWG